MTGTLFVCATPIGNLEDASPHLVDTLSKCSLILAEDTRRTLKLLSHFQLKIPMQSFYLHNEQANVKKALEILRFGQDVAIVSDAGVPTLADPGQVLIDCALDEGINVLPVSGPSAITTALSVSGFFAQTFNFRNFLPRKPGALQKSLEEIAREGRTTVVFESPFRIKQLLEAIRMHIPGCKVLLAREMTKVHETYIRGTPQKVLEALGDREVKGEITLVIGFSLKKDQEDD